jgi:RNA polymerase sigma-70 factor (sigma-E family)
VIGVLEGQVELAGAGDLGELYDRHAAEAVRVAYLLTGDRALAEDLVQDAFVRLVGRLGHLRSAESFPAYLRKTVVNLGRMQFRRHRKERELLERAAPPSAERGVAVDDDVEVIRSALLMLPYRNRAAIVLRYYCDLPDVETALMLGCARGTVRSLISRGLDLLREQIGE